MLNAEHAFFQDQQGQERKQRMLFRIKDLIVSTTCPNGLSAWIFRYSKVVRQWGRLYAFAMVSHIESDIVDTKFAM